MLRTRTIGLEHSYFKRDKVTAGKECVGRTLLSAALLLFLALGDRNCETKTRSNFKGGGRGVSAPHGLRMNRSNTSFDNSRPRGVKRMTSPSRSSSPDPTQSEIASDTAPIAASPNSFATIFEIHTSVQTQSQKEGFLQCSLHRHRSLFKRRPADILLERVRRRRTAPPLPASDALISME